MVHKEAGKVDFKKPYANEYHTRDFYMHEDSGDDLKTDNMLKGLIEEEEKYDESELKYSNGALKHREELNEKANVFLKAHECPEIDVNRPLLTVKGNLQVPYFVADILDKRSDDEKNYAFKQLEPINCGVLNFLDIREICNVPNALTKMRNAIFTVLHYENMKIR